MRSATKLEQTDQGSDSVRGFVKFAAVIPGVPFASENRLPRRERITIKTN